MRGSRAQSVCVCVCVCVCERVVSVKGSRVWGARGGDGGGPRAGR